MDSDEFYTIIAQKGLIHSRIQIFGKKAHGAYNWRGVNAIEQAAEVIRKIKALRWTHKKHPLLRGPTANIGVIKGGDKVNMVPDFCEFALDLRYVPGMDPQAILRRLRATVRTVTLKFRIIIDDVQLPYTIGPRHPAVELYLRTARAMKCPRRSREAKERPSLLSLKTRHPGLCHRVWRPRHRAHQRRIYPRQHAL